MIIAKSAIGYFIVSIVLISTPDIGYYIVGIVLISTPDIGYYIVSIVLISTLYCWYCIDKYTEPYQKIKLNQIFLYFQIPIFYLSKLLIPLF